MSPDALITLAVVGLMLLALVREILSPDVFLQGLSETRVDPTHLLV